MENQLKFLIHQLKIMELKPDEIKHFVVSSPNWRPSVKPRLLRGEIWGIKGVSFFLFADLGFYTKKKRELSILRKILMTLVVETLVVELQDKEVNSQKKE